MVSSDPFTRLGTSRCPGPWAAGGGGPASGPEAPLRFEGCQGEGVLGALPQQHGEAARLRGRWEAPHASCGSRPRGSLAPARRGGTAFAAAAVGD